MRPTFNSREEAESYMPLLVLACARFTVCRIWVEPIGRGWQVRADVWCGRLLTARTEAR